MQAPSISKISKNIIGFFKKFARKTGEDVDFIKRKDKAKVKAEFFAQTLTISALSDERISLDSMCANFRHIGINISKQGLAKRFNASAKELMKNCFEQALKQFKTAQNQIIDLLEPFSSVELIDSSIINLPSSMKEQYQGFGGDGSEAALKIQTILNYTSGQIEEMTIMDARKNDQSFKEHLIRIKKGALYLQDLGYFSLEVLSSYHLQDAYFISRYDNQTILLDENDNRLNLLDLLKKEKNFSFTRQVKLGKKHKIPIRIIAQKLSDKENEKRIRKINQSAKRKGWVPRKETLELAKWSICITNIPQEILKDTDTYLLYSLRWQIELFFKLCKQGAGIDKVNSQKSDRILCEFYAKLICVIMLLYLCFSARWNGEQEISFIKAYKCLRKYAMEFFKAIISIYRLNIFLKKFLKDLENFAMKDIKRKKPATHQKLMGATGQKVLA